LMDGGEQRSNTGRAYPVPWAFGLPAVLWPAKAGAPGGQGFVDGGQGGSGDLGVRAGFDALEDGSVHYAALHRCAIAVDL
jgi:hypothetical protein